MKINLYNNLTFTREICTPLEKYCTNADSPVKLLVQTPQDDSDTKDKKSDGGETKICACRQYIPRNNSGIKSAALVATKFIKQNENAGENTPNEIEALESIKGGLDEYGGVVIRNTSLEDKLFFDFVTRNMEEFRKMGASIIYSDSLIANRNDTLHSYLSGEATFKDVIQGYIDSEKLNENHPVRLNEEDVSALRLAPCAKAAKIDLKGCMYSGLKQVDPLTYAGAMIYEETENFTDEKFIIIQDYGNPNLRTDTRDGILSSNLGIPVVDIK